MELPSPPPAAPLRQRWDAAVVRLSPRLQRLGTGAGALVAAVVLTAVAAVAWRGAPPPPELVLPRVGSPGDPSAGPAAGGMGPATVAEGGPGGPAVDALVHAAGAVARPGLYRVAPGARVADVVDAAGGPAPEADLDQLNLAARVTDGERLYVARKGETAPAPTGGGGPSAAGPPAAPVDLNTATTDQLESLPGVGPATARAILEHRSHKGRFRSVDELLEVPGIGPAKLARIKPRVRV